MIKPKILIMIIIFITTSSVIAAAPYLNNSFQYISPIPDARMVSRETNIIIRPGEILAIQNLESLSLIKITGSISGNHEYNATISDDRKTIIFKPLIPFAAGEIVTITLATDFEAIINRQITMISYSFIISSKKVSLNYESYYKTEFNGNRNLNNTTKKEIITNGGILLNDDPSLPSNFIIPTVSLLDNPDDGYIFISNLGYYGGPPYLMILDNSGYPVYYKSLLSKAADFKKQPNGLLSYHHLDNHYSYIIDSTYTMVDSFACGNGYDADLHDFQMIDSGYVLLMAYDPQIIDMSEIVPGGDTAAVVVGLIIQELDSLKNVVFQWRSWDYYEITDATHTDFQSNTIDYVHGNTIELDFDDNLLISSRNMDEITKINRQTGEIIWRLGGINNEFTFIGDSCGFSRQHDIRRLPDGNITLFDNGVYHAPQFSRAVEYELDEINKVCTQVWEYRNNPDIYGSIMGNVQRLPNGNTMIGWGGYSLATLTEVHSDNSKAFELSLGFAPMAWTYRAFRFSWNGVALKPHILAEPFDNGVHLIFNKFGDTNVVKYYIYMGHVPQPTTIIDSTTNNYYEFDSLIQHQINYFRVTAVDSRGTESPFSDEIEIAGAPRYIPGDINGDFEVIGSDIIYGINYFRGGAEPPLVFWNDSTGTWLYSGADANGDCRFIGSDITYLVEYFKGNNQPPAYCPQTPPYGDF